MAKNKFTAIVLVLAVIATVTVCAMASEEVQAKSSSEKKGNVQSASSESLKSPSLAAENPKSPPEECEASEQDKSAWKNTKSSSKHEKAAAKQKSASSSATMVDDETFRNMSEEEKAEWATRVVEEHKDDVLTEKQKARLEKLNKMNDEQMKEWVESVLKLKKPNDEVHNSIRGNLFQSGNPFRSDDPFRFDSSIESDLCVAGCMNNIGSTFRCTTAWNCAALARTACTAICPS